MESREGLRSLGQQDDAPRSGPQHHDTHVHPDVDLLLCCCGVLLLCRGWKKRNRAWAWKQEKKWAMIEMTAWLMMSNAHAMCF